MTVIVPGPDSGPLDPAGPEWQASLAGDRSGGGAGLTVWTDQKSNRCVLRLRGRLCFDTVAVLDRHIDRLGCGRCDEVIIDLGSLLLMDGVGARLLVGLGHYVAARGGRLELRRASQEMEALVQAAETEIGA